MSNKKTKKPAAKKGNAGGVPHTALSRAARNKASKKVVKVPADIRFENHGSIILLRPLTEAGKAWVAENVQSEGWQWLGEALACDPRMAEVVSNGAVNDGLEVE